MKIPKGTKSKAYLFIKSLLKDGAEGKDVHNLISAITAIDNDEIGGTILMDLISNRDDSGEDIKHGQTWFGPINMTYYHWIMKDYTDYLCENSIRGYFRFAGNNEWNEWNEWKKSKSHSAPTPTSILKR